MKKDAKENQPVTIDGATLHVMPTPPTIHLKTADDVRLEMAKVYRDSRRGNINVSDGAKLVFMLGQIGKMIELLDIEKRIEALEKRGMK